MGLPQNAGFPQAAASGLDQLARPRTAIINGASSGGVQLAYLTSTVAAGGNTKQILSGALTANTLATALSIAGSGVLNIAAIRSIDATARTLRIKITMDGIVAYDATSSATGAGDVGMVAIGSIASKYVGNPDFFILPAPRPFNKSLLIEIATSVASETDKIALDVAYDLT